MAIKKSEIYAALWESCDLLRGGMDASLYKDYVLFMLFIRYVSDKFAGAGPFASFKVPKGASFSDMCLLKGRSDIGDQINKKIIQPLVNANPGTLASTDFPDFNDGTKLGEGEEMVNRLTSLISVFENENLDFSKNRAENDDLLGDAYEYLMRHFAAESGKSKGQFYTPAEVSRVLSKVIGISTSKVTKSTSAYDPTCGSGSLLLKVAAEAGQPITLEGQEKDVMTAGLARMNMLLHGASDAVIATGNTLSNPKFKEGESLRTYDFVVANPPFSDKKWILGVNVEKDLYHRFEWGAPPEKNGDYAYLLHIIRSLKSTGKGACILPHGVLFRGNAEAVIRENLVKSGYLKGIIGLPANLFYGTGIPACILVLDKENSVARKGIFMVDASKGFIKDGNKNRLRERDIHNIVSAFSRMQDIAGYCRMVSLEEISSPKNNYNLNLPRYINSAEAEDIHSLSSHMNGGIPNSDINAMGAIWQAMPALRNKLFTPIPHRQASSLAIPVQNLKTTVEEHQEYKNIVLKAADALKSWQNINVPVIRAFSLGASPKNLISTLSEGLLSAFRPLPLVDAYALYQRLMDFWAATMQDDFYQISSEGWKATPTLEKKGRKILWHCDLLPKEYIVSRYFSKEDAELKALQAKQEEAQQTLNTLIEENCGEYGVLTDLIILKKALVKERLKELKADKTGQEDAAVVSQYLNLSDAIDKRKKTIKEKEESLNTAAFEKYDALTEEEVKDILICDKYLPVLEAGLKEELNSALAAMEDRVLELHTRYAVPLPELSRKAEELSARVAEHLKRMGISWN